MAIRQQVNERFAASMGTNPMTMERLLRALSESGFIRKGSGGRRLHYTASELAHVVLAQAAGQPSDAPDVTRVLADLLADDSGQRLVDFLTTEIRQAATAEGASAVTSRIAFGEAGGVNPWDLTLCAAAPAYAWISKLKLDGTGRDILAFRPADRELIAAPRRSVRHMTTIRLDLILVAGELLADTPAQDTAPAVIPDPSPGRDSEGNATPETTKASETGIHEGLQIELSGLARQTAHLCRVQSNAAEGGGQPLPDLEVRELRTRQPRRPSHLSHRSTTHGSHWNDAAAP